MSQIVAGWNWLVMIAIVVVAILIANWLIEIFEQKQLRAG